LEERKHKGNLNKKIKDKILKHKGVREVEEDTVRADGSER
jgi:hypothetical protein